MIPMGTLLIIGGAEDKVDNIALAIERKNREFKHFAILHLFLKGKKKVEIITTASNYREEVEEIYQRTFDKIGLMNTGFIHIESKNEAALNKYIIRIEASDAVFFSGGDQFKLTNILGGTPLIQLILKRYYEDENFVLAGTSAGAMAMSKIMIYGGGTHEVVFRNDLQISTGFGFLEHCIIDSHFIQRGRFGRLANAVMTNPGQLGIGLGDDTALIVKNGEDAECVGSGAVVIIDSSNMGQSNISEDDDECGVFVENLSVHLLVKGCHFNLKTRKIANPARNISV
jgi:cyanophycinase